MEEGFNTPKKQESEEKLPPKEFREFFELQFATAKILSEQRHIPFAQALFTFTNIPRRLGLGVSDDSSSPEWQQYVQGLAGHLDDPVAYTYEFYKQSPARTRPEKPGRFGCFRFDAPSADGTVEIHFSNADKDDVGPLSSEKIEKRKQELKEMFTHIKQTYPEATTVLCGSWLLGREEFRRFFPASFGDSRQPFRLSRRTQGSHYWGQFLDRSGQVRPELAEKFLGALKQLNADQQVVEAFPTPPYIAKAPIEDFYKFYGIE